MDQNVINEIIRTNEMMQTKHIEPNSNEYDKLIYAFGKFMKNDMPDKAFACLYNAYPSNKADCYPIIAQFRKDMTLQAKKGIKAAECLKILRKAYLLTARDKFDDFCIFTEWDRPPQDRFYVPRRKSLWKAVEGMQDLAEDKLDILGISLPPGTGKSTLSLFYITWLVGRNPLEGILIGSHNGDILTDFYNECLRELDPAGDYRWHEVFPERKVVSTNAKAHKIDIDKAQRFSSLQFSSIGSGNAGKVRALQLLYCDDLIPGIEEALSAERLEKKWTLYNTDLRQRKYGNKCKELHVCTRWSVHDIVGRLEDLYADTGRARFIRIPALDENGESNFDYGNGKGYSTAAFLDIKKTMDDMSFQALYQNEPIEREGLLYHPDQLRRYYELPDREADAILAVCDTASGGGDDLVMPIFAVYGNDHYLIDCVVSNELPEVTDNLCVEALVRNRVKQCQFESNSAGGRTADKVEEGVKKLATSKGIKPTHITKKWTSQNKETKIIVNSAWVKEYCLFKDDKLIQPKSMYADFMKKMTTYTHKGKNKHDDVVDALAQYAVYTDSMSMNTISLLKRPF